MDAKFRVLGSAGGLERALLEIRVMTNLDVDALRESFTMVAERAPDLTHRFYDELFRRYPAAEKLFGRNPRAAQEQMLTRALVAVLEHIEEPAWMRDTLHALGAKHVGYGVTDEMYDWVGEALVASLADVAEEAWTPRVESAWKKAYAAIAGLMLDGARAARVEACPAPMTRPHPDVAP